MLTTDTLFAELVAVLKNAVRCAERDGMPNMPGSAPKWSSQARAVLAKATERADHADLSSANVAADAINAVKQFTGNAQFQVMRAGLRGEESEHFQEKFMELGA